MAWFLEARKSINDKKIKILLRLKTRIARHLVDSYFTPFQKGYTAVRRMKERAEFSLNKLTGLILSYLQLIINSAMHKFCLKGFIWVVTPKPDYVHRLKSLNNVLNKWYQVKVSPKRFHLASLGFVYRLKKKRLKKSSCNNLEHLVSNLICSSRPDDWNIPF